MLIINIGLPLPIYSLNKDLCGGKKSGLLVESLACGVNVTEMFNKRKLKVSHEHMAATEEL